MCRTQDSIHGRSQGKLYYYNFQTNEVSWHHPGPAVKQQLRDAAASYIQAVFRGHYHRKMRRLAGQHWKIDPTQDAIRRAKEAKAKEARGKVKSAQDARTNQAVTEIQRRFRGYRARKQYAAKRRSRAAVKVQSWWRGVLARRRAAWLSTSDPHINLIPAPRYPLAPLPESRHPASASRVDALVRSLFRPVLAYVAARR